MSALTDRIYAAWRAQNGSGASRGGMGAVAPMLTRSKPSRDAVRGPGSSVPKPDSRPEKQNIR